MAHKLKRTLFIGLGGTGMKAILAVKERLLNVYDPEKMKKIPPMIEFLGIDTDDKDKKKTEEGLHLKLEPAEFMKLEVENISDTLKANKHIRERIPKAIQKTRKAAINSGAGQIRALGTLALLANYSKVKKALVSKVKSIKKWDADGGRDSDWEIAGSDVNIFVIFSTSGGTGSGIFIDIAYIMQEYCNLDDDDRIFSYILLPESFIGKPGTKNVIPNSYAAFKELDFLMNFQDSMDYNITFDYGSSIGQDKFKIKKYPFDHVYVVSNENIKGKMYPQIDTIIQFIGYALFVTTGAVGDAADSIWDNLKGMLTEEYIMHDHAEIKYGNYLCFGISELFYNGKEVGKHAVNEVAAKFMTTLLNECQENISTQASDFIQANGLNEQGPDNNEVIDRMLQIVRRPVEQVQPDNEAQDNIKQVKGNYLNTLISDSNTLAQQSYEQFIAETKEKLIEKINFILQSWDGLDQTVKFLEELEIYFSSVRGEMDTEISGINEKINLLGNYYKNCLEDIKIGQASFWPNQKIRRINNATNSFASYVQQEGIQQQEKIKRQKARIFFSDLINFIQELKRQYTGAIVTIRENSRELNQEVSDIKNTKCISRAYSIDVSYDIITSIEVPETNLNDFIAFLENKKINYNDWIKYNPQRMKDLVIEYSENLEFISNIVSLTVEDVLLKLTEEDRKKIVRDLDEMSAPLCPYNRGYVTDRISTLHILGVENEASTILKGDLLSQINYTHDPSWSTTNDSSRWLIFKTEATLPGYALKDFEKYKLQYEDKMKRSQASKTSTSFHIYEGWEKFPDLIPEIQFENALKFWALGYADTFNLIKRDKGRYWIYTKIGNEIRNPKHKGWEIICESQDRIKAYEAFRSNEDFINKIGTLIEQRMNERREAQILENLETYMKKLDSEIEKATTNEMSNQLAIELREIEEFIKERKLLF
ncbi:MAG: tubulin-like doman-containing protein [Desulfobacula sp.]|nr:tubulin-like doman-containing protein [Desulfobacula sp.]